MFMGRVAKEALLWLVKYDNFMPHHFAEDRP